MWRGCCANRRQPQAKPPSAASESDSSPSNRPTSEVRVGASGSVQKHFCDAVLTDTFKECLAKQKPLHVPAAAPQLGFIGASSPLGLDPVLLALTKGSETGNVSANRNGQPCMRGNIFLAYLDHATLTMTEAERYLPPLFQLCTGLSPTFDFVTCKLALDPPGTRLATMQADADLIVLQLWGVQKAKVCMPVFGLPVTAPRPAPLLSPTLNPGDAVFVPHGLELRFDEPLLSENGQSPTLYAILSVRTGDQSLGTCLGKHIVDVLRETGLPEDADAFLRSAICKASAPRADSDTASADAVAERRAAIEVEMKSAIAQLRKRVSAASLREHVAGRMEKMRKEQAEGAVKAARQTLRENQVVLNSSYVSVSRGVVCECQPGDSHALFTRGSETLPLPISQSASYMISELCDGVPHLVGSLTCSDPLERLCVAEILVLKDCLEIREAPGGASKA